MPSLAWKILELLLLFGIELPLKRYITFLFSAAFKYFATLQRDNSSSLIFRLAVRTTFSLEREGDFRYRFIALLLHRFIAFLAGSDAGGQT